MLTDVDLAALVAAYRVGQCPGPVLADALEETGYTWHWTGKDIAAVYYGQRSNWLIEVYLYVNYPPGNKTTYASIYLASNGPGLNCWGWVQEDLWDIKDDQEALRRAETKMMAMLRSQPNDDSR